MGKFRNSDGTATTTATTTTTTTAAALPLSKRNEVGQQLLRSAPPTPPPPRDRHLFIQFHPTLQRFWLRFESAMPSLRVFLRMTER